MLGTGGTNVYTWKLCSGSYTNFFPTSDRNQPTNNNKIYSKSKICLFWKSLEFKSRLAFIEQNLHLSSPSHKIKFILFC